MDPVYSLSHNVDMYVGLSGPTGCDQVRCPQNSVLDSDCTSKVLQDLEGNQRRRLYAHILCDPYISYCDEQGVNKEMAAKFLIEALTMLKWPSLGGIIQCLERALGWIRIAHAGEKIAEYYAQITQAVSELPCGDSVLLPYGWRSNEREGHAIFCVLTRTTDTTFQFCVYNTGSGLDYHPYITTHRKRYRLGVLVFKDIPSSVVIGEKRGEGLIDSLGHLLTYPNLGAPEIFYKGIMASLSPYFQRDIFHRSFWITSQRAGTCVGRSLLLYLRHAVCSISPADMDSKERFNQVGRFIRCYMHLCFYNICKGKSEPSKRDLELLEMGQYNLTHALLKRTPPCEMMGSDPIAKLEEIDQFIQTQETRCTSRQAFDSEIQILTPCIKKPPSLLTDVPQNQPRTPHPVPDDVQTPLNVAQFLNKYDNSSASLGDLPSYQLEALVSGFDLSPESWPTPVSDFEEIGRLLSLYARSSPEKPITLRCVNTLFTLYLVLWYMFPRVCIENGLREGYDNDAVAELLDSLSPGLSIFELIENDVFFMSFDGAELERYKLIKRAYELYAQNREELFPDIFYCKHTIDDNNEINFYRKLITDVFDWAHLSDALEKHLGHSNTSSLECGQDNEWVAILACRHSQGLQEVFPEAAWLRSAYYTLVGRMKGIDNICRWYKAGSIAVQILPNPHPANVGNATCYENFLIHGKSAQGPELAAFLREDISTKRAWEEIFPNLRELESGLEVRASQDMADVALGEDTKRRGAVGASASQVDFLRRINLLNFFLEHSHLLEHGSYRVVFIIHFFNMLYFSEYSLRQNLRDNPAMIVSVMDFAKRVRSVALQQSQEPDMEMACFGTFILQQTYQEIDLNISGVEQLQAQLRTYKEWMDTWIHQFSQEGDQKHAFFLYLLHLHRLHYYMSLFKRGGGKVLSDDVLCEVFSAWFRVTTYNDNKHSEYAGLRALVRNFVLSLSSLRTSAREKVANAIAKDANLPPVTIAALQPNERECGMVIRGETTDHKAICLRLLEGMISLDGVHVQYPVCTDLPHLACQQLFGGKQYPTSRAGDIYYSKHPDGIFRIESASHWRDFEASFLPNDAATLWCQFYSAQACEQYFHNVPLFCTQVFFDGKRWLVFQNHNYSAPSLIAKGDQLTFPQGTEYFSCRCEVFERIERWECIQLTKSVDGTQRICLPRYDDLTFIKDSLSDTWRWEKNREFKLITTEPPIEPIRRIPNTLMLENDRGEKVVIVPYFPIKGESRSLALPTREDDLGGGERASGTGASYCQYTMSTHEGKLILKGKDPKASIFLAYLSLYGEQYDDALRCLLISPADVSSALEEILPTLSWISDYGKIEKHYPPEICAFAIRAGALIMKRKAIRGGPEFIYKEEVKTALAKSYCKYLDVKKLIPPRFRLSREEEKDVCGVFPRDVCGVFPRPDFPMMRAQYIHNQITSPEMTVPAQSCPSQDDTFAALSKEDFYSIDISPSEQESVPSSTFQFAKSLFFPYYTMILNGKYERVERQLLIHYAQVPAGLRMLKVLFIAMQAQKEGKPLPPLPPLNAGKEEKDSFILTLMQTTEGVTYIRPKALPFSQYGPLPSNFIKEAPKRNDYSQLRDDVVSNFDSRSLAEKIEGLSSPKRRAFLP